MHIIKLPTPFYRYKTAIFLLRWIVTVFFNRIILHIASFFMVETILFVACQQVQHILEHVSYLVLFIYNYYLPDDEADRKKKKKDKAMGEQVGFMSDIRYRFSTESTDRGKKPQIFAKPSIKSDLLNVLDFIGDQKEVVALSSSVIPLCSTNKNRTL